MAKTLIIIVGPTAVGKTALAIQVAKYFHTEIISADSRQFYREMSIGTAKPSEEELRAAPHHFIDTLSVTDNYSVGDYETEAIKLIEHLFKMHDVLVLTGGSGLFINAICNGFDSLPTAAEETRNKLNQLLADKGIEYLQEMLRSCDPVYYKEVDLHNPQRIIRALEVYETTGIPFSDFRKNTKKERPFKIIKIGLNTDRTKLYENINTRVDKMIAEGLISEVESLKSYRNLNSLNTVGYSEIFEYLDGELSKDEAVEKIKQNTRRFAKRQLTWFHKSDDTEWFEPTDISSIENYINIKILGYRN